MFQTRRRRQNLVFIHNAATAFALLNVRTCWAPCLVATSPTCLHACRENTPEHRLDLVEVRFLMTEQTVLTPQITKPTVGIYV
jgi:hypothetical protein